MTNPNTQSGGAGESTAAEWHPLGQNCRCGKPLQVFNADRFPIAYQGDRVRCVRCDARGTARIVDNETLKVAIDWAASATAPAADVRELVKAMWGMLDRTPITNLQPNDQDDVGELLGRAHAYLQRTPAPAVMPTGAIAGHCFNIDGETWHSKGERCTACGFGLDTPAPAVGAGEGDEEVVALATKLREVSSAFLTIVKDNPSWVPSVVGKIRDGVAMAEAALAKHAAEKGATHV